MCTQKLGDAVRNPLVYRWVHFLYTAASLLFSACKETTVENLVMLFVIHWSTVRFTFCTQWHLLFSARKETTVEKSSLSLLVAGNKIKFGRWEQEIGLNRSTYVMCKCVVT